MREAISKTKINPKEKMKKINDMVKMLVEQKSIKDWGLEICREPIKI